MSQFVKIRSAATLVRLVRKATGIKKSDDLASLIFKSFELNNIKYSIVRGKKKALKYHVTAAAVENNHPFKDVLGLRVPAPERSDPFTGNIIKPDPDEYLCLTVVNITFDQLVKLIVQTIKLKAFL